MQACLGSILKAQARLRLKKSKLFPPLEQPQFCQYRTWQIYCLRSAWNEPRDLVKLFEASKAVFKGLFSHQEQMWSIGEGCIGKKAAVRLKKSNFFLLDEKLEKRISANKNTNLFFRLLQMPKLIFSHLMQSWNLSLTKHWDLVQILVLSMVAFDFAWPVKLVIFKRL